MPERSKGMLRLISVDLPAPLFPTIAMYSPCLIFSEILSRINGVFCEYLKLTLFNSMLPEKRFKVFPPYETSGSARNIGLIISINGFIVAIDNAAPLKPINAPDIKPYEAMNAI